MARLTSVTTQRLSLIVIVWAIFGALLSILGARQTLPAVVRWEMLAGGILVWIPWLVYVPVIDRLQRRWPIGSGVKMRSLVCHAAAALAVATSHMAYLRLMRPLPQMLFRGGDYGEIFQRFAWGDYFFSQRVVLDLAIYAVALLAISRPWRTIESSDTRSDLPASTEAFAEALGNQSHNQGQRPPLVIRDGSKTVVLAWQEIDWIEAADYYCKIFSRQESHLAKISLRKIESLAPPGQMVRVHRRFLVNPARISRLESNGEGEARLTLRDGTSIPVSRRRKSDVEQVLRRL